LVSAPAPRSNSPYFQPIEAPPRGAHYPPQPDDGWNAPTHTDRNRAGVAPSRTAGRTSDRRAIRQRGLPGWSSLLVLIGIAAVGAVIDTISGSNARAGFNIALVVASIVAILIVRHRDMFPVVVAPPLVYIVGSAVMLYIRSGGLHNHKILVDAAANWLVYGFPAIAGATAAVLIIGGLRLVTGR
jgi:hypothetical protein